MTREENLLVTLMEECAEVQQNVSKALRFGLGGHHPDAPEETNERSILTEYYQLVATMEMLLSDGYLKNLPVEEERRIKYDKKTKIRQYQEIAKELGLIKKED